MDSKITKKRLSNFLSYEWIIMIVVCVASIFLLEMIYSFAGVRLTTGQQFKYYVDQNITSKQTTEYYNLFNYGTKDSTFSYDVLSFSYEQLSSSYNVLSTRLSVQEGDVIITDNKATSDTDPTTRAKTLVDTYTMFSMGELLDSTNTYLKSLLLDDKKDVPNAVFDYANYDINKINSGFDSRNGKDNRFRTESEKASGRISEQDRIKKLVVDYTYLNKIVVDKNNEKLFFNYTRYQQTYENNPTEANKKLYETQQAKVDANYAYGYMGLDMSQLTTGKQDANNYFMVSSNSEDDGAKDVVMLAFNFSSYKGALQYETVSYFATVLRDFTNIVD